MPIIKPIKQAVSRLAFRVHQFVHRAKWSADLRTLGQFYRSGSGACAIRARFRGDVYSLHVRGGTLDAAIFEQVLCGGSEYRLPVDIQPKVIFDVGANIGAAAVYFAARYPEAKVYCFEPLPENIELLRKNVAPFGDRVTVIPVGLGETPGSFTYRLSDDPANFGGGTFHNVGCADGDTVELPVTTLTDFCREQRIDKIDVMKIDTEGAEASIIAGTPPALLADVQVVLGELHGVDDWKVMQALTPTHDLAYEKPIGRSCYPFWAVRKAEPGTTALRRAA
jgi:FkbM family methyltransferase